MLSIHATTSLGSCVLRTVPGAEVSQTQTGLVNITQKQTKKLFIACCNVRKLLDISSQVVTMRAPYDYKVSIACLSELRLAGSLKMHQNSYCRHLLWAISQSIQANMSRDSPFHSKSMNHWFHGPLYLRKLYRLASESTVSICKSSQYM